jgi:transposase InsO family protein
MTTHIRRRSTILLPGALLAAPCLPRAARAGEPIRLVVFPSGSNWPIWVAQEQGFFARHGVSVEVTGTPNSTFQRSDQGPEFVAEAVRGWIEDVGARTAYIEKASPWENGYVESFMYGRPPRCKGELTLGGGRVRSCIRPVCAAS